MDIRSAPSSFNKRAFIAVGLFLSGLILPLSGIMNHTLQFEPLTIQRHFWMSVHNISALIFSALGIWHIALNWKAIVRYAGKAAGVLISKEASAALATVGLLVGLFASHALHVR